MSRRVGVVGVWHETNTFSSTPTTLEDFEAFELLSGSDLRERNEGTGTVIGGFYDADDLELVPIISAGAWPSGPADASAIGHLLDRVGDGLSRERGLDGLLVNLHGAMVAEGVEDVEAAVVGIARETLGDIPVGAVLDLHANPSPELVRAADVLVSYDTYPHVDMRERGAEVADLVGAMVSGRRLRTSMRKVPLLVCPLAQATDFGPMRAVQEVAARLGREAGLPRVCVVGGFGYSDVERAGMSVLAVHEPDQQPAADDVLAALVAEIAAHAPEFTVARDDSAAAVARAVASTARPVFLVDVADNIGGGSPGDGTELLRELLRVGATGAVVTIADAEAARYAADLGVGARFDAVVGAKHDRLHGSPIRLQGSIERITSGEYRTSGYYMSGRSFTMGTTAVLAVNGNTIVITEKPTPPFHAEQLSSVGVDVAAASIVVVKGAIAWRGAYGAVAGEIIEVATPGICPVDVSSLPRRTSPMSF